MSCVFTVHTIHRAAEIQPLISKVTKAEINYINYILSVCALLYYVTKHTFAFIWKIHSNIMRLVQRHMADSHYHRAANMTPVALQHMDDQALTSTHGAPSAAASCSCPPRKQSRNRLQAVLWMLEERHKYTEINLKKKICTRMLVFTPKHNQF